MFGWPALKKLYPNFEDQKVENSEEEKNLTMHGKKSDPPRSSVEKMNSEKNMVEEARYRNS